ncbi:allantoate permease [Penicillium longicatenatum]|nr:allantoate permease [Penicillium longicatenatum]
MPATDTEWPDIIAPVDNSRSSNHPAHEHVARFLARVENGDDNRAFTVEEERRVLRRIDFRVLPLLLGAYFFQQLDKSALSYTSIFGLSEDAHLVGQEYSWLSSILYLSQLVFQPLAAFLLVKAPTGKVISGAIFLWGSTLAIMSACTDFKSLLGMRFALGAFESMIAPSCIAATQMWWRRGEQTLRAAMWNGMNGLTFIVGSLFTYGLGHIHSNTLYSYQIIFLFCGLLTVCYSFAVLISMPDSPMEAKCLSDREKFIAVERLRANQMGIVSREWRWDHVWETLYDPKTWSWFFLVISISIPSGGIGSFGNLILKSFGYTNFQSILFNLPLGVIQIIAILGGGWVATRFRTKGMVIVLFATLASIGTILMLLVPRSNKGALLFGYYLVSTMAAITPMIYAWEAQNTAGDTKRKCTSAVVLVGMCTGNVIGPQLFSTSQAPAYRPGLIASLIILTELFLIALNKKHAKKREALGKSANFVDESMLAKDEMKANKVVELEDVRDIQNRNVADKGFADITDLRNEDFIYVY